MIIMLRVSHPLLDIDACLVWVPAEALQRSWKKGERRPGGKVSPSAGFNMLLAESDDARKALQIAEERFDAVELHLKPLARNGTVVEVDVGLFVGELPRSARISKEFAAKLGIVGAQIVFTAYPSAESDEEGN